MRTPSARERGRTASVSGTAGENCRAVRQILLAVEGIVEEEDAAQRCAQFKATTTVHCTVYNTSLLYSYVYGSRQTRFWLPIRQMAFLGRSRAPFPFASPSQARTRPLFAIDIYRLPAAACEGKAEKRNLGPWLPVAHQHEQANCEKKAGFCSYSIDSLLRF